MPRFLSTRPASRPTHLHHTSLHLILPTSTPPLTLAPLTPIHTKQPLPLGLIQRDPPRRYLLFPLPPLIILRRQDRGT